MSACAGPAWSWSWLAAIVAIVSQLALGSVVLPDAATDQRATLLAAGVRCDGAPAAHAGGTTSHRHRHAATALCPLATALSLPPVVMISAPLPLPSPSLAFAAASRERPPGRGPPLPTARVGAPRAPPSLG